MNSSLSILLPVHNAQATLAADVAKVLDLVPDLATRFDVVIVDDGSTDATNEIAHELTLLYPQVRLVRHRQRRGMEASLERALEETESAVVLGHVGRAGLSTGEIARSLRVLEKSLRPGETRRVDAAAAMIRSAKPQALGQIGQDKLSAPSSSPFVAWVKSRVRTRSPSGPLVGAFRVLRGGAFDGLAATDPVRRVEPRHAAAAAPGRPGSTTAAGPA